MKIIYRRVVSKRATRAPDEGVYTYNYSDAIAAELKNEAILMI